MSAREQKVSFIGIVILGILMLASGVVLVRAVGILTGHHW